MEQQGEDKGGVAGMRQEWSKRNSKETGVEQQEGGRDGVARGSQGWRVAGLGEGKGASTATK